MDVVACSARQALGAVNAVGTRSQSAFARCIDNGSTAPAPLRLARTVHFPPSRGPPDPPAPHPCVVSFPPLPARPFRLSGLVAVLVLVALFVGSPVESAAGQAVAGTTPSWQWPIGPTHTIVRPFVAPPTPYSAGHRGVDIGAASGAPVVAPADGVVHFVGVVVDRPLISIRHPGGLISSFEPVASDLTEGTAVRRGDVIGQVGVRGSDSAGPGGSTHCAESCLHFGVRLHGEYVSPLNYLGGIPLSVLLPTRLL